MAKQEVLYVPGLGGKRTLRIQQPYVRILGILGRRRFHFFDPKWETSGDNPPEDYEAKFQRLNNFFEACDRPSIIYANSAGAALAARLAIERSGDIEACHLVCGKVLGADKIGRAYRDRAPALYDAVRASEAAVVDLNEQVAGKFFCYKPEGREDDGVIEVADMLIPGANIIELPPLDHAAAIIHAARKYLPGV